MTIKFVRTFDLIFENTNIILFSNGKIDNFVLFMLIGCEFPCVYMDASKFAPYWMIKMGVSKY
jgi:hypothetical protein